MNPGSGDKKEDNQRRVFYSASFVRQENPGIPVRIKQICTVYSSTAHQHVCTKGMPIKVGLHLGNKAGPFGTPMKAGLHPGNKAGPFKSHGIIPSWCNILLRIRILRIYWFGWFRIFILRNSETFAEFYLSQNRYLIINKLHFPSVSCNGVLQGPHSIPLHPPYHPRSRQCENCHIEADFYFNMAVPTFSYVHSASFLCPDCKTGVPPLQE